MAVISNKKKEQYWCRMETAITRYYNRNKTHSDALGFADAVNRLQDINKLADIHTCFLAEKDTNISESILYNSNTLLCSLLEVDTGKIGKTQYRKVSEALENLNPALKAKKLKTKNSVHPFHFAEDKEINSLLNDVYFIFSNSRENQKIETQACIDAFCFLFGNPSDKTMELFTIILKQLSGWQAIRLEIIETISEHSKEMKITKAEEFSRLENAYRKAYLGEEHKTYMIACQKRLLKNLDDGRYQVLPPNTLRMLVRKWKKALQGTGLELPSARELTGKLVRLNETKKKLIEYSFTSIRDAILKEGKTIIKK